MNPNNIKLDSTDFIKGVLYILEAHSLQSLTSEATHTATQFFKRSCKISVQDALPPCLKVPKLGFKSEFS